MAYKCHTVAMETGPLFLPLFLRLQVFHLGRKMVVIYSA